MCQAAKDCLQTSEGSEGITSTPAELAEALLTESRGDVQNVIGKQVLQSVCSTW